jgi:hypothetical protein
MTSSLYAAYRIPGNHVTYPLGYLQVAVGANPGFRIVGIGANASLRGVLNPSLYFGASNAKPSSRKIKLFRFVIALRPAWPIVAWH